MAETIELSIRPEAEGAQGEDAGQGVPVVLPWRVARQPGRRPFYAYIQRRTGKRIEAFNVEGVKEKETLWAARAEIKRRGWQ